MAFQPFGNITQNNFKLIPLDTPVGTRVKCILRAYKEGFDDIVLETLPVTISQRPGLYGSDVYISDRDNGPQIQTIIENNFVFAVDDIVGEDGITYQFYVEYPVESGILQSGTGYPGISGDYGASLPGWEVDGVKVEHVPYFNGTTSGLTANVGDQTAYGAQETVIACWTTKNSFIMDEDLDGDYYHVSLQAYHHSGINKVQFQLNDGPVLEVTEVLQHPIDGIPEYICKIDINDPNLMSLNEVRAIVYPNNGRKLLMQGFGSYPRVYFGGTIEGGETGELFDPTLDSDYVSYNSNGDGLYYESLFLFKRTNGYTGEIYFDYQNGDNENGDGSERNPYKTIAVGVQKYLINELGYDYSSQSTAPPSTALDGYSLILMPGDHKVSGWDPIVWYSQPSYGRKFPVVIRSQDPNDRAIIIGSEFGPGSEANRTRRMGQLYMAIIKDIDIEIRSDVDYTEYNEIIYFNNGSLPPSTKGAGFLSLHKQNLNITYPNETRVITASDNFSSLPSGALEGELAFKWKSPRTGDFNPNYPSNSVRFSVIYFSPIDGIKMGSKTNCVTKFGGAGSSDNDSLARGNVDYSGYSDRGYVSRSVVNNKLYGTSLEVPTVASEDIENNTSPTAYFWTTTHVDVHQPADGKFQPSNDGVNKTNYYPKVFSYNEAKHRDYSKKGFGVNKSQFWFEGDGHYRKAPGSLQGDAGGYKWEVGQGTVKNQACVKNSHINHGSDWSFAVGTKYATPGVAYLNYYVADNLFTKVGIGPTDATAYKTWTWKNNYNANTNNPLIEQGPSPWNSPSLALPATDQNDYSHLYSPFYQTLPVIESIPKIYSIAPGLYPVTAPGGAAGGYVSYPIATGGYDSYYGLDVYDKCQILVTYDGFSGPTEVSPSLNVKFILTLNETQEYLKPDLLDVNDGYLRNMERLEPFGMTFEFQWKRDGVPLIGETGITYQIDYNLDIGSEISCGITAQEILPYVNPIDYRVGYKEITITLRGNSFDVPSNGQFLVGQPENYSDGYGFHSYIYGKDNTPSGISGSNKSKIMGIWHNENINSDIQYVLLSSSTGNATWRRFHHFNEDGTDKTTHQPYRKIWNIDSGISFDYVVGINNTDSTSDGDYENRSRENHLEAYSYNLKFTLPDIPSAVLNILRDASDNNQRVLYAYSRVPQEMINYPLYIYSSDLQFDDYSRVFFGVYNTSEPNSIARVNNSSDVAYALRQAAGNGITFAVRNGGHSYIGESIVDGGIVIDLRNLDGVTLNGDIATIGGGAYCWQVDREINCSGAAFVPVASGPYVGFSGFMLAGGLHNRMRRYGIAADNLVEAEVVLADGSIVIANESNQYSDLFQGLKGLGNSSLGIVTEWKVNVNPGMTGTRVVYDWDFDITQSSSISLVEEVFNKWQNTLTTLDSRLDSFCSIRMINLNSFDITVSFYCDTGNESILSGITTAFLDGLNVPSSDSISETSNNAFNCATSYNEDFTPSNAGLVYGLNQSLVTKSPVPVQIVEQVLDFYKEIKQRMEEIPSSSLNGLTNFSGRFLCDGWGGAITGGTGMFAYRDGLYSSQFYTNSTHFSSNQEAKEEAEEVQRFYFEQIKDLFAINNSGFSGGYPGYPDAGIESQLDYYYGENKAQFEALKLKYDPTNTFPYGFKI